MLFDQRKTRRMAQIAAIIAAVGFVGIIFIVVVVLVVQGGSSQPNAVKTAQKATQARPNDPVAWDELATAQAGAQKYVEAQQAAQKAYDLRPNGARVGTLVQLMLQNGQQAGAFNTLETFTAQHPKIPQGFLYLGQLAEQMQKKNVALLAYATYVRLAPKGSSVAAAVQQRIQLLRAPPVTTTKASTASTPTAPATPGGTTPAQPVTP
jgi:predicted Zn-dependent protease